MAPASAAPARPQQLAGAPLPQQGLAGAANPIHDRLAGAPANGPGEAPHPRMPRGSSGGRASPGGALLARPGGDAQLRRDWPPPQQQGGGWRPEPALPPQRDDRYAAGSRGPPPGADAAWAARQGAGDRGAGGRNTMPEPEPAAYGRHTRAGGPSGLPSLPPDHQREPWGRDARGLVDVRERERAASGRDRLPPDYALERERERDRDRDTRDRDRDRGYERGREGPGERYRPGPPPPPYSGPQDAPLEPAFHGRGPPPPPPPHHGYREAGPPPPGRPYADERGGRGYRMDVEEPAPARDPERSVGMGLGGSRGPPPDRRDSGMRDRPPGGWYDGGAAADRERERERERREPGPPRAGGAWPHERPYPGPPPGEGPPPDGYYRGGQRRRSFDEGRRTPPVAASAPPPPPPPPPPPHWQQHSQQQHAGAGYLPQPHGYPPAAHGPDSAPPPHAQHDARYGRLQPAGAPMPAPGPGHPPPQPGASYTQSLAARAAEAAGGYHQHAWRQEEQQPHPQHGQYGAPQPPGGLGSGGPPGSYRYPHPHPHYSAPPHQQPPAPQEPPAPPAPAAPAPPPPAVLRAGELRYQEAVLKLRLALDRLAVSSMVAQVQAAGVSTAAPAAGGMVDDMPLPAL